ncbi:MAG: hypothetical protein V4573_16745 [Pseudomonadota bacterium]
MTAQSQLDALQSALHQLRSAPSQPTVFSNLARDQQILAATLPERFNDVLLNLLDRLESSALFTEESCSFSHAGLLDSLQMWIDKAQLQLQKN